MAEAVTIVVDGEITFVAGIYGDRRNDTFNLVLLGDFEDRIGHDSAPMLRWETNVGEDGYWQRLDLQDATVVRVESLTANCPPDAPNCDRWNILQGNTQRTILRWPAFGSVELFPFGSDDRLEVYKADTFNVNSLVINTTQPIDSRWLYKVRSIYSDGFVTGYSPYTPYATTQATPVAEFQTPIPVPTADPEAPFDPTGLTRSLETAGWSAAVSYTHLTLPTKRIV